MTPQEAIQESLEAFNAHDEERIRAGYAENATFEAPGDVRLEGAEAITAHAMGWLTAFSDGTFEIYNQIVSGEWVAARGSFRGTHDNTLSGPAGDIPATNRRLEGAVAEMWRVVDGKIVEEYLYFDQVELLTQLGLMPEPATV
jgi:predicted ester cyclase